MNFTYEVAISFAGEDRSFAEAVAKGLSDEGIKVFYDDYYSEELWGEDLSIKLRDIYHEQSMFCIMVLSQHYIDKMWTSFERQQAIDRLIKEKGKAYVLPLRLDSFSGEVPGLSDTIGYLSVSSNESGKVVAAFLRKIGRQKTQEKMPNIKTEPKIHIPKIKKKFTDKEKNKFFKSSFEEIVNLISYFAKETQKEYPHIDYETEMVTSRKALFTFYENEEQVSQLKIMIGGMFGGNSITVSHSNYIDIENDGSANEIISIEEQEGELKLKPTMGMTMYGGERDRLMSPRDVAEYIWESICGQFGK